VAVAAVGFWLFSWWSTNWPQLKEWDACRMTFQVSKYGTQMHILYKCRVVESWTLRHGTKRALIVPHPSINGLYINHFSYFNEPPSSPFTYPLTYEDMAHLAFMLNGISVEGQLVSEWDRDVIVILYRNPSTSKIAFETYQLDATVAGNLSAGPMLTLLGLTEHEERLIEETLAKGQAIKADYNQ
jgi:hypothetical protein